MKQCSEQSLDLIENRITPILKFYVTANFILILGGISLDYFSLLDLRIVWIFLWISIIILMILTSKKKLSLKVIKNSYFCLKKILYLFKIDEKIFVFSTLVITFVNLLTCLFFYAYNWDSMSYHLARVMYFIQHQNTDFFNASYWAQIFHPVYSSYLNIAFLMLFADERGMNLVQFFSGCFAAIAVFGIAFIFSENIVSSILSGCVFINLTQVNLQMTSTQNDLWMSSLLGCSLYFLIVLTQKQSIGLIFLSCLSIAIALGGKLSGFLYLPAIFTILFLTIKNNKTKFWYCLFLGLIAFFVFFTSGYWENITHFGTIAGSQDIVEKHSLKEFTLTQKLQFGWENTIRYSAHFFSLDGMPNLSFIVKLHQGMKKIFISFWQTLGTNSYNLEGTREPFIIDGPYANENISYWGVLGFLVWLSAFLSILMKRLRNFSPLAFGAIIFLLTQSFSSQYDPWRGRYFIACAIFAVPITSLLFHYRAYYKVISFVLTIFLFLSSFSSIATLALRMDRPLIPYRGTESILTMNYIEQLTSERTVLTQPAISITDWLDRYPNLPLYTILPENFYDYILFRGNKVIPLHGVLYTFQETMLDSIGTGLLLYDRKIYPNRQESDIRFSANLFGRILDK